MNCNVGGAERTLRFGVGAALVGAGSFSEMSGGLRIAALLAGSVAIATAAARYCPASALLGIDTCRRVA